MPFSKSSDDFMARFRAQRPDLERIIERHLPGNFSKWEEEHSTWNGPIKTVDGTEQSPVTLACAWGIFFASEVAEEGLGHVKTKVDLEALIKLERAIGAASDAFNSLSTSSILSVNKESLAEFQSFSDVPPVVLWNPLVNSLLKAIPHTKAYIEENYEKLSKQNWKAMAVAEECRVVFSARTGLPAAIYVLDKPLKKSEGKPAPLAMFIKDIFTELGINSTAAGALDALRTIRK